MIRSEVEVFPPLIFTLYSTAIGPVRKLNQAQNRNPPESRTQNIPHLFSQIVTELLTRSSEAQSTHQPSTKAHLKAKIKKRDWIIFVLGPKLISERSFLSQPQHEVVLL